MKKTLKKFLSGILTVALVFSMTAVAFAADPTPTNTPTPTPIPVQQGTNTTGTGSLASLAAANVWSIKFPTDTALNFVIDPTKIVKGSGLFGEDLEETIAQTATFLFPNYTDNELTAYSDKSDDIKVENRGTTNVVVALDAQLTSTTMKIEDGSTFTANSTDDSILLQITDKTPSTAVTKTLGHLGAQFEETVACKSEAWESKYDKKTGAFQYSLTEEARESDYAGWNSASFSITGQTNPNGKWEDATLTAPNLKLAWDVRNANIDTIAVTLPAAGTGYTWATSVANAYAGQKVSIYLLLDEGYEIASTATNKVPGATTATVNTTSGAITADDALTALDVTEEATSVNDVIEFTFTMPAATGNTAFSKVKADKTTANVVTITAPDVSAIPTT